MDNDFGKFLQKARTDRGLSVEQAAAAVKIRSTFIRSLESSDLTKFPNAAYAKSFLLMYGRFLGVDLKAVAAQIDTTTQMKVEGYQYLTSRAAAQPKSQPEPELTFSAAPTPKNSSTWLPLLVLGGTLLLALTVFIFWNNMNRLGGRAPAPAAMDAKTPGSATAVEPLAAVPAPVPAVPVVPVVPPVVPKAAPVVEETPPRPAIISSPDLAPSAAAPPTDDADIPKARAISPVARLAASDSDLLADLGPPKPRVISTPVTTPPPLIQSATAGEENETPGPAANSITLEPRRKTWVVIRTGPGGQPLFEDYLYTAAKPLRLPPGRYFIELKEADAVEISRNGKRIGYSAPGVIVE